MSQHLGSVNRLSEHPASPALLTSHGPHGSLVFTGILLWVAVIGPLIRTHLGRSSPDEVPVGDARPVGGTLRVCQDARAGPPKGKPTRTTMARVKHAQKEATEDRCGTASRRCKEAYRWVSCLAHSQFENRLRGRCPPGCLSCVALPDVTTPHRSDAQHDRTQLS